MNNFRDLGRLWHKYILFINIFIIIIGLLMANKQ